MAREVAPLAFRAGIGLLVAADLLARGGWRGNGWSSRGANNNDNNDDDGGGGSGDGFARPCNGSTAEVLRRHYGGGGVLDAAVVVRHWGVGPSPLARGMLRWDGGGDGGAVFPLEFRVGIVAGP